MQKDVVAEKMFTGINDFSQSMSEHALTLYIYCDCIAEFVLRTRFEILAVKQTSAI